MNHSRQTLEDFYALLPEIYRVYDYQQGNPLKAILAVIYEQLEALQENIDQLYDDQFIETCASWVVPYIGELIGYRPLHGVAPEVSSPRADVANTIQNRRKKGTAASLEQTAFNVTGWRARVVELFQLLATTQYMNHLRPENRVTVDFRRSATLARLYSPFETNAHLLDVRRISTRRGRHNIPNIGIFLWRLEAMPVTQGTARQVAPGCYTFHPFGLDQPLFNQPETETGVSHLAEPIHVPEPLPRRALYTELEALRQALANGKSYQDTIEEGKYFGLKPRLTVWVPSPQGHRPVPQEEIVICDLRDQTPPPPEHWRRPPEELFYIPAGKTPDDKVALGIQVGVDPVLGRLAFPLGKDPGDVWVSYSWGFSAQLGGGEYPRVIDKNPDRCIPDHHPDIQAALDAQAGVSGVVEITGSRTLAGDVLASLSPRQSLILQAGSEARPVLDGILKVQSAENATLLLDGLWITGGVQVLGDAPMSLILQHCTLPPTLSLENGLPKPPPNPAISWDVTSPMGESRGRLVIDRSVLGQVQTGGGVNVEIQDSILDALSPDGFVLAGSPDGSQPAGRLKIQRSTLFGCVHVREVELVEDSLLTGPITADRRQEGCMRFSYLPVGSKTPRQFACQPARAVQAALASAKQANPALTQAQSDAIEAEVQSRVEPVFTSTRFGDPGYAQLSLRCPVEICTGAEAGSEMGVFHHLFQPQREINLRTRLDEYLRFGLEAGIFYVI